MKQLCSYGCGQEGSIKNKSNKGWRCSQSPNSCPAVKETKRQKMLKEYGVENISQCKNIQEKKKKTWIKNYGVDNPAKAKINRQKIKDAWPEIKRKREKTSFEKYGVSSYTKTSEFQTRRKETWIKNYGVDNPVKNPDIAHKVFISNSKSEYRTKTLILPSGKLIRYQGNEDKVILDLLKSGLKEHEIVTGPGNVPHIKYEFEGKTHRYYPDIYIPKYNQLIEVKSKYTWKKYKAKNLAKREASIKSGYNYSIAVR